MIENETLNITKMSPEITELVKAMVKFQGMLETGTKDLETKNQNGKFNYKYADLAMAVSLARKPLFDCGLCVIQTLGMNGNMPVVITYLMHESGQYMMSEIQIRPKADDAQAIGSAITYMRRYAYCAILGIVFEDDDDDGNAASQGQAQQKTKPLPTTPPKTPTPPTPPTERVLKPAEWNVLWEEIGKRGTKKNDANATQVLIGYIQTANPKYTIPKNLEDLPFAIGKATIDYVRTLALNEGDTKQTN